MADGHWGRQVGTVEEIKQADVRNLFPYFTALWAQAGHLTSAKLLV